MNLPFSLFRAVCYADIFDFPLTLREAKESAIVVGTPLSRIHIQNEIQEQGGYLFLRGREHLVYERLKRKKTNEEKLNRAKRGAQFLSKIPTISALFLTGGVAVGNAQENDDIDFMIITKPGWLWTTRCVVVLLSKMLGVYTHKRVLRSESTQHDANTWCLNLWLDETALEVPKEQRNLYTAHEVIQAVPLFDRHAIADEFLSKNRWASDYIAPRILPRNNLPEQKITSRSLIENFCFWMQYQYMKHSMTHEKISRSFAFFHPMHTSNDVLRLYQTYMQRYAQPIPYFYTQPKIKQVIDRLGRLRKDGKTIVLATGVFDLLHDEHRNFLMAAKRAGDVLVVGVESDKRARELKGEGRPKEPQNIRLKKLKELSFIDFAFILPENFNTQEDYEYLLRYMHPQIYACSSHTLHQENKQRLMKRYGGELVVVHTHNPYVSTTRSLKEKQRSKNV
ncbi:MAG: adenylyltransferase/cytidyltransferase family protein [Candidatus Pacebacteria bacterium]|nr:adenylyltransferase/cytidyltransferase family protein [Candidatus Paceibacterota bacterium]